MGRVGKKKKKEEKGTQFFLKVLVTVIKKMKEFLNGGHRRIILVY